MPDEGRGVVVPMLMHLTPIGCSRDAQECGTQDEPEREFKLGRLRPLRIGSISVRSCLKELPFIRDAFQRVQPPLMEREP